MDLKKRSPPLGKSEPREFKFHLLKNPALTLARGVSPILLLEYINILAGRTKKQRSHSF